MNRSTDPLDVSLVQWVQGFDEEVQTWADLSDGRVLWAILDEIDRSYFGGPLPEPDVTVSGEWTRKWQNLKHVEKQVSTYYRDVCNGQYYHQPDLKAIAADADPHQVKRLIMIIIRAAMASHESNQRMGQRLMNLGREHAMAIATELKNMDEEDHTESTSFAEDASLDHPPQHLIADDDMLATGQSLVGEAYRDPMLEREEELLQAQATITQLQTTHASLQIQLRDLRSDRERLQEAFDAYRSEIDAKGSKRGASAPSDDNFKKLQRQAENDRAYIDDLEDQLTSNRNTIDGYERQLERLKSEGEMNQTLKDDLQMLRADNEDLTQKLKANENLKKKIQTLQEHDKNNAMLREELRHANERLEDMDRLKQAQANLEKEVLEKKGLIRNQEYQISELSMTRKNIEYEARVLEKKLEAARDRHDRDHEAMQLLREKLNDDAIDEPELADSTQDGPEKIPSVGSQPQAFIPKHDANKNMAEKVAILEQQLEAADARLKQASQRNAALEDLNRGHEGHLAAQKTAESRLEQLEIANMTLRKELESSRERTSDTTVSFRSAGVVERETQFMVTAWYDLASRLQHASVSVTRRKPESKSWIARQRNLVGPSSGMIAS